MLYGRYNALRLLLSANQLLDWIDFLAEVLSAAGNSLNESQIAHPSPRLHGKGGRFQPPALRTLARQIDNNACVFITNRFMLFASAFGLPGRTFLQRSRD